MSPVPPALEGGFFTIEPPGKSQAQLHFPTSLKQDKKHMRPVISKVKNLYALCGKFLKRWEYQTTLPDSWETCMHVKKQQLELDMEQHTGLKLRKEYVKALYFHPAYLTYMQSTSCQKLGGMNHKLELRLLGEISITSDTQIKLP